MHYLWKHGASPDGSGLGNLKSLFLFVFVLPVGLLGGEGTLYAQTATANFNVTITIQAQCSIAATTLDFGSQPGVITANVDSTNTISVTCTNTTPWTVSLSTGSSAAFDPRTMTGPGGATVDYNIYRDAARTEIWGDGTGGTFTVTGTGNGGTQPQTGYGRVPPQAAPTPGGYSDSITATVTF